MQNTSKDNPGRFSSYESNIRVATIQGKNRSGQHVSPTSREKTSGTVLVNQKKKMSPPQNLGTKDDDVTPRLCRHGTIYDFRISVRR